jgi:hypothetical protein
MKRQQLQEWLQRLESRVVLLARDIRSRLMPMLRAGWGVVRPVLRTALEILLALVIVFEEWGWRPLADLLGRLARWRPWAAVEALIIRLPPYAALVVFALPTLLLLPLKLVALLLIRQGSGDPGRPAVRGRQGGGHRTHRPSLHADTAGTHADRLVCIGARHGHAVEGGPDGTCAGLMGLAVGARMEGAGERVVADAARRWRPTLEALKPVLAAAAARVREQGRRLVREIKARWAMRRSNL